MRNRSFAPSTAKAASVAVGDLLISPVALVCAALTLAIVFLGCRIVGTL